MAFVFALGCTGTIENGDPNGVEADLTTANLLSNPSFETAIAPWSSYQGSITRVALADAPSGRYVARVARTAGASFSIDDYPGEVKTTSAGAIYHASAQVKTATATTGKQVFLVLREYAASGQVVHQTSSAALNLGTSFHAVSVTATTTTVGGRLDVFAYQGGATSGDAFFIDAITLAQTNAAPAPDLGHAAPDLGSAPTPDLAGPTPDLSHVPDAGSMPTSRDPLKWPFASTSIWNMPIGDSAVYVPANLPADPAGDVWVGSPGIDDEHIVLTPTAPLTPINYSSAAWSGTSRCAATGGLLVDVPMPSDYVVPTGATNSGASFLMPDGHTIIQTQPLARCTAGGPATSLVQLAAVDLYGPGITGAHGGSGLSAIGGSIRVGELRPGQVGMRHALKVNVYGKQVFYKCTTKADCYRWPAITADSYAVGFYGTVSNNTNTAMKMGALLAIPASTDIASLGLETEPGRQIAWTLQNYGAYVVDDTYGPNFNFSAENGAAGSVRDQFQADWGYALEQTVHSNTPWSRDVQRLVPVLEVVDNNGPSSIGGGGTPRQPLAPSLP